MTDKPVSLFVCHTTSVGTERGLHRPSAFAFEHEGLPAFQQFISLHRPLTAWRRAELQCDSEGTGRQSQFRWHADGTIQHVGSCLWLNVNPNSPAEVALDLAAASCWAALPAA
mmetsp:Transcript_130886/g.419756  ORF Transcript_130886/g.419756 Transcript_130886/m.419756 type:complete len:113 (-) Transcript_130886:88-426(-)